MQLGFSTRLANVPMYFPNVFPRRIWNTTSPGNTPIILRSYLTICTARNRRILASLDELRRDAGDSMALKYGSLSNPLIYLTFIDESEDGLQRSLDRARSIPVIENDLTREFLRAREISHPIDLWSWEHYKELQLKRHRMGEYCCSNLDWDWDTASCLKRLFRIDRPKKCPNPDFAKQQQGMVLSATIDVPVARGGSDGRTLDVTIPEKGPNVLEKIRVRYKTETGEVRYKTFYAGPSVEDVASGASAGPEACLSSRLETGHGELVSRARVSCS